MSYVAVTNNEIFKAAQKYSPNFAKETAKFGYDELMNGNIEGLTSAQVAGLKNDFLQTVQMMFLNEVFVSGAKDYLEDGDFGVTYNIPIKGIMQNMYVSIKHGCKPGFKNIQNGKGSDPFRVRKPDVSEIFYIFNFDYQNYIFINENQMKTAFESDYGVQMLISGQMEALANEYKRQLLDAKLQAINEGINSVNHPLQASQQLKITLSDTPTAEELKALVNTVKNVKSAMTLRETKAFNSGKWLQTQDASELRMLVRPSLDAALGTELLSSAFHKEDLNLDIKQLEVGEFGGLIPSTDGTLEHRVYVKYDAEESPIGFNTAEDGSGTDIDESDIVWYDPNADVIFVIADKRALLISEQNPYTVEGIYNPSNQGTTYWANKPTVGIYWDFNRNVIVGRRVAPTQNAEPTANTINTRKKN